jgi:beta-glucosidase
MEGRTYRYLRKEPLFPFGFGLSYTQFAFGNLRMDRAQVAVGDEISVSLDVTNTGDRAGDQVVQLYVRHPDATMPRPAKELKGFKRISLEPGERKTMIFGLHTHQLGYYDETMRYAVHPGSVEVLVGDSSQHLPLSGRFEITGSPTEVSKVFFSRACLE